jgi:rhodanese-related sulfurtransferase
VHVGGAVQRYAAYTGLEPMVEELRRSSAVFIDARAAEEFAKGNLPRAVSAPVEDVVLGKLKKIDLPKVDFKGTASSLSDMTRIINSDPKVLSGGFHTLEVKT